MYRGRLTLPSLLAPPRLGSALLWGGLLIVAGSLSGAGTAAAGPPKIGKSDSVWADNLWSPFTSWKLPSFSKPTAAPSKPASSQPSFTEATRTRISRTWNSVQRKTRSAWESTKYALRPYDPPAKKSGSQRQAAEPEGFWSGLFGSSRTPPQESTVNDFLRQPMPQ